MAHVSVLMPMRNAAKFVHEAIESVLIQHGAEVELIIVDDGSTDDSRAIAAAFEDPRIRLFDGPQRGIAAALNTALGAARGQFLMRCDADDRLPPDRLLHQFRFLQDHPEFGAVCGQFCTMSPSGAILAEMDCGDAPAEVTQDLRAGRICTTLNAALIRTPLARELRFREPFITAEDIDFFLRLGESTRVWFQPRIVYHYRLHDESITHTQPTPTREFYEQMARHLQQERLATGSDRLTRGQPLPPAPNAPGGPNPSSEHIRGILQGAAWRELRRGRRARALATGMRLCIHHPAAPDSWRNLAALMLKRTPS